MTSVPPAEIVTFIGNIHPRFTRGDILDRLLYQRWGIIQDIILLPPKPNKSGVFVSSAIVYFHLWTGAEDKEKLLGGDFLKLFYDERYYWKMSLYRQRGAKPRDGGGAKSKPQVEDV
jgi:hypothetical protein